jgi:hypothetical protein
MESEENNYPVPLYDDDLKYIINQEYIENSSLALTKMKSQSDDKKNHNEQQRRDSFLEKNKVVDVRSNIKNSPILVKKPIQVKIDEKLNQVDNLKSTKITTTYTKQTSNGSIFVLIFSIHHYLS